MCVCVCVRGGGGLQGAWEDSTAVRHARQKFYNFTTPHFHPVKISTKILSSRVGLRTSRTVSTLSAGIHPGYIRIAYHFTRAKKKKKVVGRSMDSVQANLSHCRYYGFH